MPGKHVHWADNYAPSPSFSLSTLPSTPGPATPSSYGSQYCPLPAVPIEINPIFSGPVLNWNLMLQPPALPADVLKQPLTNIPLPVLRLSAKDFPWMLTLHAQQGAAYLTVGDFIAGLYRSLRQSGTAEEFQRIPSQHTKDRVTTAYIARCDLVHPSQLREQERAKGLKRIDFLCQKTLLMGVTVAKNSETFQLVLA